MKIFTCEETRAALSDLVAGEVGIAEGRSLEAHLAGCARCTAVGEEILWQDRVLAERAIELKGDRLAARIRDSLTGVRPKQVTEQLSAVRVRPRRRAAALRAAAAVAAAVLAGAVLWRTGSKTSPPAPEAAAPTSEVARSSEAEPLPAPVDVSPPEPQGAKENVFPAAPAEPIAPPPAPPAAPPAAVASAPGEPSRTAPAPEEPAPPAAPAPAKARPNAASPPPHVIEVRRTPEEAVRAGLAFLRGQAGREPRTDELVLWTLLHAGVPENDPDRQRLLKSILDRRLERTYNVSLQAMVLEEIDRVKYQPRIAQCAQFLADNQCRNGQWSYGDPSIFVDDLAVSVPTRDVSAVRAPKSVREFPSGSERAKPEVRRRILIRKMREGPEAGDNSNSMFAALGLRACFEAGVEVHPSVLERAAAWWRSAQIRDSRAPAGTDGWCYGGRDHSGHRGYGSMTAGAVGSLVIYDYLLGRDWRRDPDVRAGLEWLARHFSTRENPGSPEHGGGRSSYMLYYYLYALERAAILYGTETVGKHAWYAEGVEALLETQRSSGAWTCREGGHEVWDTCFALLFLRKAVPPLPGPPVETQRR